ncbi:PspC domain-containing protein [Nocardioides daejeonensis]|uniref:PspC domain-containing protein n=1 Tax=Nocardioides daejeonensis TaxID=1046556 RepID=UPI0013A5A595|nr:PspC domain-containing protein [Nocardioides daejeonensis]
MNNESYGGSTQSPPPPPPEPEHTGPRVSRDDIRDLGRLRRTRHDKYVAGVAGGLGRHLDIDPVILRVAFVVLTFFGGAGIIVYAACWLLVPEDGSDRAQLDLDVRSRTVALVGAGVLAALALVGDAFAEGPGGWIAWPLLVIGLIAWLVLSNRDRRRSMRAAGPYPAPGFAPPGAGFPPPGSGGPATAYEGTAFQPGPTPTTQPSATPPPVFRADRMRDPRKRGPILFWFTLSLIALSLGTLGIVDGAGAAITDSAYPALALGIIAAALLVGAFLGRAGGLIPLGLVATVVLVGSTAATQYDGSVIHATPGSSAEVESSYDMAAGEIVLDLTEVRDLEGLDGRTIRLDGGAGRIEVRVPEQIDVIVDASIDAGGEVRAFDRTRSGWDVSLKTEHDGGVDVPTLRLDADLVFGEIEVVTR